VTGERFSWSFIVGGAVMLLGVYVAAVHRPGLLRRLWPR
jgi:hypothetical protein